MNCSDILELTPLYIAGELDSTRSAAFDAHLKVCPACMRELETQARLDERLREVLLAEELDVSGVNRRIRELIAADSPVGLVPQVRPKSGRWVTAIMGIAASLLVLAAGYLLLPSHVARVYADAARDHQWEVVDHQPRPWLTDPVKIAALAAKAGDFGLGAAGAGLRVPSRARENLPLGWPPVPSRGLFGRNERIFAVSPSAGWTASGRNDPGRCQWQVAALLRRRWRAPLASFQTSRLTAVVATDQPAGAAVRFAREVSAAL